MNERLCTSCAKTSHPRLSRTCRVNYSSTFTERSCLHTTPFSAFRCQHAGHSALYQSKLALRFCNSKRFHTSITSTTRRHFINTRSQPASHAGPNPRGASSACLYHLSCRNNNSTDARTQLPHVHLISQHKYPLSQQLTIDQAYQCLVDAPKVVKQIAPMQWQYLGGPHPGTVFLTWVGGRMQNSFATDGYVWADQEQRFTQDFGAYVSLDDTHGWPSLILMLH